MFLVSENSARKIIRDVLAKEIQHILVELDPNKHYILVVPGDFSEEELRRNFSGLAGLNIVILSADNVKLLEIT